MVAMLSHIPVKSRIPVNDVRAIHYTTTRAADLKPDT